MRPSVPRKTLLFFALIYFAQGAALAYLRNFQKPYLYKQGIDADVIGILSSILLLPFILKIFIGMLSDRVNFFGKGHRKPYIVAGLLLAAITFSSATFIIPSMNFVFFAIMITLGSFSVALFDSTTDGLAIDITPEKEHGKVQGIMTGGRAAGFIILSLVFGALVNQGGYNKIYLIAASMLIIPLFFIRSAEEQTERNVSQSFDWAAFRTLRQPHFLVFTLFAILYSIVSYGVDSLVTFYLSTDFQAGPVMIGNYGALRGVGAVIGAISGGILLDRLGGIRSTYTALVAISISAALIALAGSAGLILALGVLWGISWGFQEAVYVALSMRFSDTRIAASMFALLMAISNIGIAIGEGVATGLTDNIGFKSVFLLLAGLNILCFPIIHWSFKLMPENMRPKKALTNV